MGFVKSEADSYLFVYLMYNIIVLVYVDNILIVTRSSTNNIAWFKKKFLAQFKIKDLGKINQILGANIIRDQKARIL